MSYISDYKGTEIDESVEKYLEVKADGGYVSVNELTTILGDYDTSSQIANTYLPLTGGTITGTLTVNEQVYLTNLTTYLGNSESGFVIRDSNSTWVLGKDGVGNYPIHLGSTAINQIVRMENSNGKIVLNGSGNVGIGTAEPSYKLHVAGNGYFSSAIYSAFKSGTWVNSLTNSAITLADSAGSYGGWICGPTVDGRITISTYQNSTNCIYLGYGERGRTTNSFAQQIYWDGKNNVLYTGKIQPSWIHIENDSSNNADDAIVYIRHRSNNDWNCTLDCSGYDYGLYVNCKSAAANGIKCLGAVTGSSHPTSSSYLIKTNIKDMTEDEAFKILNIRPISFDYKEGFGNTGNFGVIAEEVESIIPSVVVKPEDYDESLFDESKGWNQSILGVDYPKFTPYLIKMIQIQQEKISSLENRIQILEDKQCHT